MPVFSVITKPIKSMHFLLTTSLYEQVWNMDWFWVWCLCILGIYKLWQPNYLSSVTDCVLKLLLKQVFKKISILQGNLKHIASITVSCAILTMCHNFRKGTSNIWQAESDKWLRIHLGCWFFDQFQTFILSHVIDFYNIESKQLQNLIAFLSRIDTNWYIWNLFLLKSSLDFLLL